MVEIEVNKKNHITETVDVEFPIYREHCGKYTRIEEDGTATTVWADPNARNSSIEHGVEIEDNYNFTEGSEMDYHLGRGIHKCSEQRFNETLERAQEAINGVETF